MLEKLNFFNNRLAEKTQRRVEAERVAEQRRATFLAMFEHVSADGHGEQIADSQVLDQSYELGHFDLHKVPNHSVIIDTEDFKPPPRGKYEFDIVKRTPNPKKVHEPTKEELTRRAVFDTMFDHVSADARGSVDHQGEEGIYERVDFHNLASEPVKECKIPEKRHSIEFDFKKTAHLEHKLPSKDWMKKRDTFVDMMKEMDSTH